MYKVLKALFVITLAISLLGGIGFVLAQSVGLISGNLALLKTLNKQWKTPIVQICSVCAVFAFLLHYFVPAPSPETAEVED